MHMEKLGMNEIYLDRLDWEARETLETIWFTADLHHSHKRIITDCNRPVNVTDHDEWLIEEVINKHINKKDRLYILGDVSMASRKEAEKFISRLKGQKFLILGNHDKNIKNTNHFVKIDQMLDFTFRQFGLDLHIVLCHYPMMSWNKSVHGSWSLYGHVHGRLKHPYLGLDVGIDNDEIAQYRPINLLEIIEYMQQKKDTLQVINNLDN